MSQRMYDIHDITHTVKQLLKSSHFLPGLYDSVENICAIFSAIVQSRGERWTDHLYHKSWTTEEKKKLETLFQPYLSSILSFFNGMRGGADEDAESDADEDEDAEIDKSPDNIFIKIRDAFQYVDSAMYELASQKGIIKYEKAADKEEDYHIFPSAIVSPLTPLIGPVAAEGLKQFKVPLRTLIVLVYLFLDMTRIGAATAGQDSARKSLSIAVALVDFLRGDWKRAILSIMGYFGTAPLFMGQLAKAYLFLFQMLSPRIQDNFIFGAYDAIKSFIMGLLLTLFKVTAPYQLRKTVIEVFETIAKHKKDIDGTLESADLNPLPEYMTPSFEDLNNLQALMDDPAFLCSKEHQELIKSINQSEMLNILLQLARIPVTEQFIKWKCEGKPARSFVEELADRQKKPSKKNTNTVTETPVTETPTVAQTPVTETPVTETPTVAQTPVTETPVTETPITETPITETPVTETPVTETPITETPVTETPTVAQTPVTETPTVAQTPVTETPITETPITETPVVAQTPVTETPVTETPVEETPITETPITETPITETPITETPITETPITETPVTETPITETPITETPITETPIIETPITETPITETPITETPVAQTPVEETPTAQTPVTETPVTPKETPALYPPGPENTSIGGKRRLRASMFTP